MLFVRDAMPSTHTREGPPYKTAVPTFQKAAEEACPDHLFKPTDFSLLANVNPKFSGGKTLFSVLVKMYYCADKDA